MEYWSAGVLECWKWNIRPTAITPILHYSSTPELLDTELMDAIRLDYKYQMWGLRKCII
jgi:hypothetical protein